MHTLWYFNIAMKNHTCSQVNHVLVILNRPCSVAMLNYHELPEGVQEMPWPNSLDQINPYWGTIILKT